MAYCRNCGAPINDTDAYCQHCGAQNLPAGNPNYSHYQAPQDVPSTGIKVLCFLFPLIGLILYLVERDTRPITANAYGKMALIGVCVEVGLALFLTIASISVATCAISSSIW